jgi:hypothetical protein
MNAEAVNTENGKNLNAVHWKIPPLTFIGASRLRVNFQPFSLTQHEAIMKNLTKFARVVVQVRMQPNILIVHGNLSDRSVNFAFCEHK